MLMKFSNGKIPSSFFLIGFYGHPTTNHCKESWELLRRIGEHRKISWLVVGDFNKILYQFELVGKSHKDNARMTAFRNAITDVELFDLGYKGSPLTLYNGRKNADATWECLD